MKFSFKSLIVTYLFLNFSFFSFAMEGNKEKEEKANAVPLTFSNKVLKDESPGNPELAQKFPVSEVGKGSLFTFSVQPDRPQELTQLGDSSSINLPEELPKDIRVLIAGGNISVVSEVDKGSLFTFSVQPDRPQELTQLGDSQNLDKMLSYSTK
jgi:hypothetical protein